MNEQSKVLLVDRRTPITAAFVQQLVQQEIGDVTIIRWSIRSDQAHYDAYEGCMVSKEEVHVVYTAEKDSRAFTAYRCELCGREHREHVPRCTGCGYPKFTALTLTAQAFCAQFGHDGGEVCVSDTARFERTEFRPYVEDGITIGGSDETIYSYEYLFRCARCGFEQRTRR